MSRLTDARHFIGGPAGASNTNTERLMEYDLNGNITWLQRYGATSSDCTTINLGYTGNRLTGAAEIESNSITPYSFGYDANGNRTSDSRTGLEFTYNLLNLPCEVRDSQDNMQMRYTHLSDGTKVSALDADSAFRYRYAGKEEQRFGAFDSQLLDFGARCYDPWSCQWTAVDAMAEKYYAMTPYGYCAEVPIKYYDPNGTYVAIQYQQNGKTYSYIFNGTGKLMPKNSFVQAFVEAYSSNKENWARAGLPGDSPTTELVERSDFKVTIKQTIGGSVEYVQENGGTPVIYWDPFRGSKGNTGIVRSPASVLAHESDHAVDDLTNAKAHSDRRDKENQKNEGCRKISNILHSC